MASDDCACCEQLEKLIETTTELGRQLEAQREAFRRGAEASLGLLKLAASGAGTAEDRADCIAAVGKFLAETSSNVLPPIQWPDLSKSCPSSEVKH